MLLKLGISTEVICKWYSSWNSPLLFGKIRSAERKDSEMAENLFRLFFQDDYNEKHDISTVYKPLP